MNNKDLLVLFDLDGTLIDSKDSIVNACNLTFKEFELEGPKESEIVDSIGIPIHNLFSRYFEGEIALRLVERFRENLVLETPRTTRAFPGVENLLQEFKSLEVQMSVVTNKGTKTAISILNTLKLDYYFNEIIGLDFGRPKPAPDLLLYASREWRGKQRPIMIGDRREDLLAAESAGFSSVIVSVEEGIAEGVRGVIKQVSNFAELSDVHLFKQG